MAVLLSAEMILFSHTPSNMNICNLVNQGKIAEVSVPPQEVHVPEADVLPNSQDSQLSSESQQSSVLREDLQGEIRDGKVVCLGCSCEAKNVWKSFCTKHWNRHVRAVHEKTVAEPGRKVHEKKGRGNAARAEISAPASLVAPQSAIKFTRGQGNPASAESSAPAPHPGAQIETKSKRRSRVTAIGADTAEKMPPKVIAAEKKVSTVREKSRKSLEKRQVVPSSKPDPHGSQAGPDVLSTVAPLNVSLFEEISTASQDVHCFSDFHRESNTFSMNPTAERSVHFSN